MSEPAIKYKRIRGWGSRRRGFLFRAARCSVWLGPDHLLSVDRSWINESYKRFYFRDIQSITIEQTRTALVWNYVFGSVAVFVGLVFYAFAESAGDGGAGWLVTGGIIAGACLFCMVVGMLRGPSCICRLRTAVQTEELPSLGRTRAARRALFRIKPLIEEAQGALTEGQLASRITETAGETAPMRPYQAPPSAPMIEPAQAQRPASGNFHVALYATLIVDALTGFITHLHPGWRLYFLVSTALLLAWTGLGIMATVKQRGTALPAGLKGLTAATFAWSLLVFVVLLIFTTIGRVRYSILHYGRMPAWIDFYGVPGFRSFSMVSDGVELGLGVAGLIMALMFIQARRRAAAVAEEFAPEEAPR